MSRIGIYTEVAPPHTGGVRRWLDGLLGALRAVEPKHEYFLLGRGNATAANVHRVELPVRAEDRYRNHLYTRTSLSRLARGLRLDLLHVPNAMPVVNHSCPTLVSVYDIVEFALPYRVYELVRHHYRRLVLRSIARRADHIATGSQHARQELIDLLGVPPRRVTAISPGLEGRFQPPSDTARAEVRARYQLPEQFVLYVGKIQPRKNIVRLLRAFARIRTHLPSIGVVMAGASGWMNDDVYALLQSERLGEAVRFTGVVPDEDLPALYGSALFFAFPSLYEGFGFPVLEAMACGAPVLTSGGSSLAEVAGNCALLVDPMDEQSIADGFCQLAENEQLRSTLRARGLERVRGFRWETCARQTIALYERLSQDVETAAAHL